LPQARWHKLSQHRADPAWTISPALPVFTAAWRLLCIFHQQL